MKRVALLLFYIFLWSAITSAQEKMSEEEKLKDHILSLDMAAWNAWKNKDIAFFKANTTESFQSGGAYGFSDKAEMIATAFVDCHVESFSLDDVDFVSLNKKAVMLTYTATQEGSCAGQPLPSKVRATVTYVKQGGKWLEAFYMEAAMNE